MHPGLYKGKKIRTCLEEFSSLLWSKGRKLQKGSGGCCFPLISLALKLNELRALRRDPVRVCTEHGSRGPRDN